MGARKRVEKRKIWDLRDVKGGEDNKWLKMVNSKLKRMWVGGDSMYQWDGDGKLEENEPIEQVDGQSTQWW